MDIEDIKNKALKELVMSVEKNDASATIGADLEDALNESSNDEELTQNWQAKLESLYQETQHYWGELENMKSGKQCIGEAVAMKEGIAVKDVQTPLPLSPQTPQNPLVSLAGAIRQYLKERGIWQTIEGKYTLNDEVSRQVRKDTVRFGIEEKHRMGI